MQIQLNQGVEKMEQVLQEYEQIKNQNEEMRQGQADEINQRDLLIQQLQEANMFLEKQKNEVEGLYDNL